ncbi:hypothetical protein BDV25DRAFT_136197 [Aspergillus avenaceus]|uniref:Uncharacterized protein n=1 Tax=Aspergillus avenaceus TaxID=36643 RepID=A0A5N6U642_ASPAV|nr:hypothetical protein BDV25DRAFT_136197 [Aspergillus avenaceus]
MSNISQIHEELFRNNETRRVVLKMRAQSLDLEDLRSSTYRVINDMFPDWENDNRVLFLAAEIWGDRAFMAIDINNHEYNFQTAHKTKIVFPVHVLWLHKRKGWILVRWPQEDKKLAERLAYLHNINGFAATPFLENHNFRVIHANPRDFSWTRA